MKWTTVDTENYQGLDSKDVYVIFIRTFLSTQYLPGKTLNTLHTSSSSMFAPVLRVTNTILILQRRKLKLREVKSYTRAWQGQPVDPGWGEL